VARVNAISVNDVRKLAGEIFTGSLPTVAAVGALGGMMEHDDIVQRFGARAAAKVAV
jgi:hypothetical protein